MPTPASLGKWDRQGLIPDGAPRLRDNGEGGLCFSGIGTDTGLIPDRSGNRKAVIRTALFGIHVEV